MYTLKSIINTLRVIPSLSINHKNRKGNLILYLTNRCNSQCKTCTIWQEKEKYDIRPAEVFNLIRSKTVGRASWLVEGGEAILHPKINEILGLLKKYKVNYTLLSNGILTEKLVRLVTYYKVPAVGISVDGPKHVYNYIRGYDGFDNVITSITKLQNKTRLHICYTATPWNTYEDYQEVKTIGPPVLFNIYCPKEFKDSGDHELIDQRYCTTSYIKGYNDWVNGKLKIPCYALLFNIPVLANGDVILCMCHPIVLGNIYKNSIDDIWRNEETKRIQKQYLNCHDCWMSCYKYFDIKWAELRRIF